MYFEGLLCWMLSKCIYCDWRKPRESIISYLEKKHQTVPLVVEEFCGLFFSLRLVNKQELGNARLRRGWSRVITGPRREKMASGEFIRFEEQRKVIFGLSVVVDIFLRKIAFFRHFVFLNFPQFVPRGEVICDHRMLHFWIFSRMKFIFP